MKKIIAGSLAALTAGSALAAAAPAAAASYHHRHNDSGAAVAAGIAGLAIGAALASSNRHDAYGYGGYYAPRRGYYHRRAPAYYAAPGYYDYGYRCRTELRWNYRWGGYDRVRVCY